MKEIKAIIKPNRVDPVLDVPMTIPDLPGITVSQIEGFGRQRGGVQVGSEGSYAFVHKTKLELAVSEGIADAIVETIRYAARTGQPGDGEIFVVEVVSAVRIRSGERDDDPL